MTTVSFAPVAAGGAFVAVAVTADAGGNAPLRPPHALSASATTPAVTARQFTPASYCTVIAAIETVTPTATLLPDASLTVTVHVPAPCGVTAYVAAPVAVDASATEAIVPLYGLQLSLSVK